MKAQTAAIIAVFGHLKNSNVFSSDPNEFSDVTNIQGNVYRTKISYSWQDKNHEYSYALSVVSYDQATERLELEIRSSKEVFRAELIREATHQYSINFGNSLANNNDVVPWFKIDEEAKYIHDGYHQNADSGEEGPFTGLIELDGQRAVLNGHYNNEAIQYIVKIIK